MPGPGMPAPGMRAPGSGCRPRRVTSRGSSRGFLVFCEFREHRRALPLKRGGRLSVDMLEELCRAGTYVGVHAVAYFLGELLGLGCQLLGGRVVEQGAGPEVGLEPGDRVAADPGADLRVGSVTSGVVGVGMRLDPVGEGLDEGWPAASGGTLDAGSHRRVYNGGVVAVDEQ